jgi:CheY-like chemotaxis protein
MTQIKTVLLVDDNLFIQEIVADFLRNQGFRVEAEPNGKQALRRLSQKPFDLILTDLIMPDMDGFEFIEQLKILQSPSKVILMTGGSNKPDFKSKLRAIEAQGYKILEKPFSKDSVLALVNQLIFS